MSSEKKYTSFGEFFPFYLSEHSNPLNRALHYCGTIGAIVTLVYTLVSMNFWCLLLVPVVGYGPAWVGHFIVEKNRPATFTYPNWSLWGDFKMLALFLTGRLKEHLKPTDR
jgi:hypothetical protein